MLRSAHSRRMLLSRHSPVGRPLLYIFLKLHPKKGNMAPEGPQVGGLRVEGWICVWGFGNFWTSVIYT